MQATLAAVAALLLLIAGPALAIDEACSACMAVASELQRRLDAETPRNHLDLRHRLDKHGKRYGKVIAYKLSELRAVELLDDLCARAGEAHALITIDASVLKANSSGGAEGAEGGGGDDAKGADADAAAAAAEAKEKAEAAAGAGKGEAPQEPEPLSSWLRVRGSELARVYELGGSRPSRGEETVHHRQLTTWCSSLMEKHEDAIVEALKGDEFGTEQGVAPVLCERIAKRCAEDGVADLEDKLDAIAAARKAAAAEAPADGGERSEL